MASTWCATERNSAGFIGQKGHKTVNLDYDTPTVDPRWGAGRETHDAVAMAIHAIASADRAPEAIWKNPTPAECDHVTMAVEQYISAGLFPAEHDGVYPWGRALIKL
jgi:hypothetical protein